MQSLKDLALLVSEKKPFTGVWEKANVKDFFKLGNLSNFSLEYVQLSEKVIYIYDLLDVLNNPMKLQLNQIRT